MGAQINKYCVIFNQINPHKIDGLIKRCCGINNDNVSTSEEDDS